MPGTFIGWIIAGFAFGVGFAVATAIVDGLIGIMRRPRSA